MRDERKPVVVLLSGGLDSATVLGLAKEAGFDVHAMTFRYGQRHHIEVDAAQRIARHFGVRDHVVVDLNLRLFGGSALTSDAEVPSHESLSPGEIPVTYVPARNTVFLSFALAWAEVLRAHDIFVGVNANDNAGYPDCRPAFLRAFEHMADLATREGVEGRQRMRIHAPLSETSKAGVVAMGLRVGVPFEMTWSCYVPQEDGRICSKCDACALRRRAFAEYGMTDPLDQRGSR